MNCLCVNPNKGASFYTGQNTFDKLVRCQDCWRNDYGPVIFPLIGNIAGVITGII